MLTNFFIPRQKEGWLALWAVPLFRTQQVFQTCFYFSEVFRNLSHILSYCYTRLTRDLCLYWDGNTHKLHTNFDNVFVSVLHCLRTSLLQGFEWLFSIGKKKWNYYPPPPPPSPPPLYAWRVCNRHRHKESINLILYELKLIFCYRHWPETFTGNIVIVIVRWEFKVQACYFSIVPYICGGICHNHIKLFITFWCFLYVFDTWL